MSTTSSRGRSKSNDALLGEVDEDDDLRSLLSGNSREGGAAVVVQNPHSSRSSSSQQHIPVAGDTSSPLLETPADSIADTSNNMQVNNTNGSGRPVHSNRHNAPVTTSNSKKTLWILGSIILAIGLLGPSGLLGSSDEDHDISDPYSAVDRRDNAMASSSQQYQHHGDKHHQIPQADQHSIRQERLDNVHPMIRSANGPVQPRHHEPFGTKHTNKKKKRKDKIMQQMRNKNGGGGNNGIKDAINNIDKVFLDNHPVPKKNRPPIQGWDREDDNGALMNDYVKAAGANDESIIPVVHADDDTLPKNADELDSYTYDIPAADALECRASVVAFVINATDIRDECDGLRKAFDKTCSVHNEQPVSKPHHVLQGHRQSHGHSAEQQQQQPAVGAGGGRKIRRRLSERGKPRLVNLIPEAFQRELAKAGGRLRSHLRRRLDEHNMHQQNHHHHRQNRTLQQEKVDDRYWDKRLENREQRKKEQSESSPDDDAPTQEQKQEHVPPMISLNIPTADKHISEGMLNDALLLQQSEPNTQTMKSAASMDAPQENVPVEGQQHQQQQPPVQDHESQQQQQEQVFVPPPPPPINPNITAASAEAVQDAAESAEAIRTAVEGVKHIMNDPKSIEARTCCASILSVFHEHCDPTTTGVEDYSDRRLLVVVFVITVCGMVKSIIRHLNIRWLPEAGGCILVGVFGYLILQHMPHVQFAFDGDMFLRIMVPPIVFEAAVKINKQSFRRHVIPITIFAIVGTLASTASTAFLLYKGSSSTSFVTTIPMKESLIFGALISSIDPIAVLSVLNNMGMNDTDTIYVLIFGESLLNDGVAIVLFQTLVHFLDESLVIDGDVLFDAFMHFVVVAVGSISVGALSGACATIYFGLMHGMQTPMVEVIMFSCWAFIPYYICDMVEWSGIVAIVANGFVMDLFVIGQKPTHRNSDNVDDDIDFLVNGTNGNASRARRQQKWRSIFSYEGHLSAKADNHVHFVIEIFATLMETAIFAYLGLFLFSPRYHWSAYLTIISISATVMGRVIMIPLLSHVANLLNRMNVTRSRSNSLSNNNEGVHIDRRMQLVLVFAGLRGAMSFALVEHIPMFDTTTGQGSRLKPELKAMTSASVIFTVFVLGGGTSYLMEKLGYSIGKQQETIEITPLIPQEKKSPLVKSRFRDNSTLRNNGSVRQRGQR